MMDWKEKLLSSDAARANPAQAQRLIAIAEAALNSDRPAMVEGMEEALAPRSPSGRPTSVHPAAEHSRKPSPGGRDRP